MTTDNNQSLTTETLRAIAGARGVPVDDELLEELRPMVADMYDLADGIAAWLDRQAAGTATNANEGPRA